MEQLAIALESRDEGIRRAKRHAERVEPGFAARSYADLLQFCRHMGKGRTFTSEEFRDWIENRFGAVYAVPKALGHTFQKAAKEGLIRKSKFAGIAKERHGSPCPVWEIL